MKTPLLFVHKRIKILFIIATIVLFCIGGKLVYTTIFAHAYISDKAMEMWERSFPIASKRGSILDCNGNDLVYNEPTMSVAVIPYQIKDKSVVSKKLSAILNVEEKRIFEKINKISSIVLLHPEGKKISYQDAEKIKKEELKGVYLVQDYKRIYPYKERLASLLGFTGIDGDGLAGIENYYNSYLKGKNGTLNYVSDAKGGFFQGIETHIVPPSTGFSLRLTLDSRIQDVLENAADIAMKKYSPEEIYMVAMNPNNGKILGIGNRPTYDNNNYQNYSSDIYNRVLPVFSSFEPGSTFKAITFASAINEKVIDIDKDTYYDKGYEIVKGRTIKSWKKGGHGLQTFLEVLQNSSNPGFVEISRRLGSERLYQYLVNFGVGNKTGVDIAGENKGIIFSKSNFDELNAAVSAFGQGIALTPIQLVTAFSATINGGNLLRPHILDAILNTNTGEEIYSYPLTIKNTVISKEASKTMRRALESVVSKGSGRRAFLEGYRVGGKTGTAQISENGVYLDGQYILSFIAAAPMNDPKVVVYFAMKKPKNCIQYGGTTVGPIIQEILSEILPLLNVKKDYSGIEKENTWMDVKTYKVPNFIGLEKSKVKSTHFKFVFNGEGNKVIDQLPKVGEKIEEGKTIWIMLGE